MLKKLLKLVMQKRKIDYNQEWYTWASVYFEGLKDEVLEVEEELKENNSVYLEDELWDIFWCLLNLIDRLEDEWKIWWIENILKRSEKKISERIKAINTETWKLKDSKWKEIKKKQKKELEKEHKKKYF